MKKSKRKKGTIARKGNLFTFFHCGFDSFTSIFLFKKPSKFKNRSKARGDYLLLAKKKNFQFANIESEGMSFRGKRKSEGHASDEKEGHAPPKKAANTSAAASEDSDNIVICEISKNRRVSVRNWNGKIWVDIREFYVKDGKQLPGKKGISLSLDQWKTLRDHAEAIDKAFADNS